MVSQKTFREDLFYRLDVIHLTVPPLRQRKQDIPLLIDHFLERFATANASVVRRIAPDALMRLVEYSWPGNVRELENVIESLVIRTPTAIATVDDLPGTVLTPAALHDDDQPAPDSRLATELIPASGAPGQVVLGPGAPAVYAGVISRREMCETSSDRVSPRRMAVTRSLPAYSICSQLTTSGS